MRCDCAGRRSETAPRLGLVLLLAALVVLLLGLGLLRGAFRLPLGALALGLELAIRVFGGVPVLVARRLEVFRPRGRRLRGRGGLVPLLQLLQLVPVLAP